MTGEAWIGIDLGGTNLRAALVAPDGSCTHLVSQPSPRLGPFTVLQQAILTQIRQLRNLGVAVRGVGLALPATIDRQGRIASAPNLPFLEGIDLCSVLCDQLELPVGVCNDADAAAWGEFRCGAGRGLQSFLMATLGTGVGGALILDGALWRGVDGMAGELGHVNVEPEGRPCGCGSRGCLEQYASASGIVQQARELLARGEESLLAEVASGELNSATIAVAARKGDRVARRCFDEAGRRLGQVLGGVAVNLLNLEGAVIGGAVSASSDLLLPVLNEELAGRAFKLQGEGFKLLKAQLGDAAGVIGAALLARRGGES